ncbi:MAG TPA: hypothetical protein PLV51_13415, partial [Lentimicrobium sp.]|nr:hypothetical protein [Lentimicrobium sp.]
GPHLDFRFYKNGAPVDPLKVESPPALPVKNGYLADYNRQRLMLVRKLDSINMPVKQSILPIF